LRISDSGGHSLELSSAACPSPGAGALPSRLRGAQRRAAAALGEGAGAARLGGNGLGQNGPNLLAGLWRAAPEGRPAGVSAAPAAHRGTRKMPDALPCAALCARGCVSEGEYSDFVNFSLFQNFFQIYFLPK